MSEQRDWTNATLTEVADHVEAVHHSYMKKTLPHLTKLFESLGESGEHLEIVEPLKKLFYGVKAEMVQHTIQEETVLFPLMREMDAQNSRGEEVVCSTCSGIESSVKVMENEHTDVLEALAHMRSLTSDYSLPENPADALAEIYKTLDALEADVKVHISVENDILHKKAVALENASAAG